MSHPVVGCKPNAPLTTPTSAASCRARRRYDVTHLVDDPLALLGPETPVLVLSCFRGYTELTLVFPCGVSRRPTNTS